MRQSWSYHIPSCLLIFEIPKFKAEWNYMTRSIIIKDLAQTMLFDSSPLFRNTCRDEKGPLSLDVTDRYIKIL